jgi:hypothetical protein
MISLFSLVLFKSFSLFYDNLTIMCLPVELFEFILLKIHWAFNNYESVSFLKFCKISGIISSSNFYANLFFSLHDSYNVRVTLFHDISKFLRLSSCFSIVFSFCSSDYINSNNLCSKTCFFLLFESTVVFL